MKSPHQKITFTVTNKLYGDREVTGYGRGGLVVHKVSPMGRGWTISQASSGMTIRGGSVWGSKQDALDRVEKLLSLPIEWEKPFSEMSAQFGMNGDAVREIIMDGVVT